VPDIEHQGDSVMQVKDVMAPSAQWIAPATTIAEAAVLMRDQDIGFLPIGEDGRLVGTITDRDLVVRAVAKGRDPQHTTVAEVMSEQVLYCFEDQQVEDVARNMGEQAVRRLPVVNHEKQLVGIVSLGDLARYASDAAAGEALSEIASR
jgi:CBS domain-containing protein